MFAQDMLDASEQGLLCSSGVSDGVKLTLVTDPFVDGFVNSLPGSSVGVRAAKPFSAPSWDDKFVAESL